MKRKAGKHLLWNVGHPEKVEDALISWGEKEVDIAVRDAVKTMSFSWIFRDENGWSINAIVWDELTASIHPKKLIDSEMDLLTPITLAGASADHFADMDQFCDHLLWCARYASEKANRLKKKAGLIP